MKCSILLTLLALRFASRAPLDFVDDCRRSTVIWMTKVGPIIIIFVRREVVASWAWKDSRWPLSWYGMFCSLVQYERAQVFFSFGGEALHGDNVTGSVMQERSNGFHEEVGWKRISENFICSIAAVEYVEMRITNTWKIAPLPRKFSNICSMTLWKEERTPAPGIPQGHCSLSCKVSATSSENSISIICSISRAVCTETGTSILLYLGRKLRPIASTKPRLGFVCAALWCVLSYPLSAPSRKLGCIFWRRHAL